MENGNKQGVSAAAVPVTLIAGYLGSGKTTWLNARIRGDIPGRSLILVNDFGAINIDADLIEYRSDRLVRLSNGCICCSLSESLAVQLAQIARWPSPPSAVYIETSGVAQPQRIIDLITVSRQFGMRETIGLVNGHTVLDTLADTRVGALVSAQIVTADRLSVNRLDLLAPEQRAEVRQRLVELNPGAAMIADGANGDERSATCGTRPGAAGVNRSFRSFARVHRSAAPPADHDIGWQRFAVTFRKPVCRADLEALLLGHAQVLARAKGILEDSEHRRTVFQWSGGRASWTPTSRRGMTGQLVGIGFAGADFDALIRQLEQL